MHRHEIDGIFPAANCCRRRPALGAGAALGGLAAGAARARRTRRSTCGGGASRNCPACRRSSTVRSPATRRRPSSRCCRTPPSSSRSSRPPPRPATRPTSSISGTASTTWRACGSAISSGLDGLVKRRHPAGLEPDAAQPLRRQHLPRRLVPAADALDLQQGRCSSKAGLDPEAPPDDLGRAARRLRKAEDRRHRAARRRHPGRLLERMVHQPCAARRISTRSARRSSSSSATRISATRNITSTGCGSRS